MATQVPPREATSANNALIYVLYTSTVALILGV